MTTLSDIELHRFNIVPEILDLFNGLCNEDIQSFQRLLGDPDDSNPTEWCIYMQYLLTSRDPSAENINEAIARAETWADKIPRDDPDYHRRLGILHNMRACQDKLTSENDSSINLEKKKINSTDIPKCSERHLNDWAKKLSEYFDKSHELEPLNLVIEILDEVISRQGEFIQPDICGSLALHLGNRYELTESIQDLHRACSVIEQAKEATEERETDLYGRHIGIYGSLLSYRYSHSGNTKDLDDAIDMMSQSVNILSSTGPEYLRTQHNLGICLFHRYRQLGSIEDLNRAIDINEMVKNMMPEDHICHITCLYNLSAYYCTRFNRTGVLEDINHAIELSAVVLNTKFKDETYFQFLMNHANCLMHKYEELGADEDVLSAIQTGTTALEKSPNGSPTRQIILSNVGNLRGTRFIRSPWKGDDQDLHGDLEAAISLCREAVNITPTDSPQFARNLLCLGNWLHTRFEIYHAEEDANEVVSLYEQGWESNLTSRRDRIKLAIQMGEIYACRKDWAAANRMFKEALELLPGLCPRSLKNIDKDYIISKHHGLASAAAAVALNAGEAPYLALQALEQGRGVVSRLLLEMRTEVSDLQKISPELAKAFQNLRDNLDSPSSELALLTPMGNSLSREVVFQQRRQLSDEFEDVLKKIRELPEFHDFLMPSSEDEILKAASSGPVIVLNPSPYRCDAFLVQNGGVPDQPTCISSISLPELTLEDIEKHAKLLSSDLTSTLCWLWRVIALPCLNALGLTTPITDMGTWPRIWWCPTGDLTYFPLHAAGHHHNHSRETVIDRAVSSYIPSIKTLVHTRAQHNFQATDLESRLALLIHMQDTPGFQTLHFARKEVEIVNGFCSSLQLLPKHSIENCRKDVLDSLSECKVFHFAGHGELNLSEPSKSLLLLQDWKDTPLTVGDMRAQWFQKNSPFLAYLSACSTSVTKVGGSMDEAVHLTSSCQLAGFRHAIGTLWEVADDCCVDAARNVYQALKTEGWRDFAVAIGVHSAARWLRENSEYRGLGNEYAKRLGGDPRIWAAYIHCGP